MSESATAKRLGRARSGLAELGVEALLISHVPNVRYLTGFSGSSGWLLLGADLAVFVTDGRYEEQAREELAADAGFELRVLRDGMLSGLAEWTAREFSGARVGFEARHISYEDWSRLDEEAEAVRWEAVSGLVENLRAVKDDDEIAAISKAAEIASEALLQTLPLVKSGVREAEVASEIDYRMVQLGAEGPAFETIVASGSRTALPHAATGRRRIQAGELLLCDFGARWRGYCSDLTRTFAVGKPSQRQTDVHATVREAQREALSALRAGSSGMEVDTATREAFERRALDAQFVHSTGHGLGLEVHEAPRLGRRSEEVLEAQMVVTIEPGLYFPGWGGVRIEDDVVVTGDQPRLLANLERDRLQALPG